MCPLSYNLCRERKKEFKIVSAHLKSQVERALMLLVESGTLYCALWVSRLSHSPIS